MRIWSLNPALLDSKGLVACWRETLLAQKVLRGLTRGYRNHPQLDRFKATEDPLAYICTYLHGLADEAERRGYNFNRSLILMNGVADLPKIEVQRGQIDYEIEFLRKKIQTRDPAWYHDCLTKSPVKRLHSLFSEVPGGTEPWEKIHPLTR